MKEVNRIILNTGILYIKLLLGVIIGMITTRLVLDSLGETNYGIYVLVAGVVGMLGVLNSAMSSASMRFIAHSLGTGVHLTSAKTFNTTLFLHLMIGLGVIIIMELGGLIMFKYFLNIPEARLFDAKIVFHFMVLTTFVTIISVPYDAVMNSHEDIFALSVTDMLGYIIKLGIGVYLSFSSANLLILYGFLMLCTQVILRVIKQWYSRIKYDECKIRFREYVDKHLVKTILSFSGWNLFGSIAAMTITQVRGILLNLFFGVGINAADGISKTASSQVNLVSASMTRALNPQLVKNEGRGNRKKMLHMTELATKYSVYLFALFAIPVIFEAPYLLKLWLKVVPKYTAIFCQLVLIGLFLDKFTFEITSAIRAVGNIKKFQITETFIILFNIPLGYLIFKLEYPPFAIFGVNLVINLFCFFERLYFGKIIAGMNISNFVRKAILPVLIPVMFAALLALVPSYLIKEGFIRLSVITICSMLTMTSILWKIGLTNNEKIKCIELVVEAKNKFFRQAKSGLN